LAVTVVASLTIVEHFKGKYASQIIPITFRYLVPSVDLEALSQLFWRFVLLTLGCSCYVAALFIEHHNNGGQGYALSERCSPFTV